MRQKRPARIAATLVATAAMSGCVQQVPIISVPRVTNNMTLTEQRDWVSEQLDAAVAASGVPEGWYDIFWHDVFWAEDRPEDRAMLYAAWFPDNCGGGTSGRLSTGLKNMTYEDPPAAAARIRASWEAQDWNVSDMFPGHDGNEPNFVARFEDGGLLEVQAGEVGMSIAAHTGCSTDHTVTNWQAQLDDGGNPFIDELERRGEEFR